MSRLPIALRSRFRLAVIAAALALCVVAAVASSSGAGSEISEAPEKEWAELPGELVRVLQAKSDGYLRRARGFTCTEKIRRATYRGNDATGETRRVYEYLLVSDESAPVGFRGLRTTIGSSGRNEVEVDNPYPEPYAWTQLFNQAIRSTMRFDVGEWHTTPYKLAIPISWQAAAPVFEGSRITEWSGEVEIEYRTGNLLLLTARPNLQDDRIVRELERFLTAFRIMGFSTAAPPIGRELTVRFDYEHEGFAYPTEIALHSFRQVTRTRRRTESRRVVRYEDYRFFGTTAEDEIPPLLFRPEGSDATLPLPVPEPRPDSSR